MDGITDESECAACGRVGRYYRILRLSAPADAFPDCAVAEGGINDHLDGYLPLCADCLLVCPTCGYPVVGDSIAELLITFWANAAGFSEEDEPYLRWYIDPCGDPSHERPGRREEPPQRTPAPIIDPSAAPGGSTQLDEFRGIRVGDLVSRSDSHQVGRVLNIFQVRRLGVGATVEWPDGTRRCQPSDLQTADD